MSDEGKLVTVGDVLGAGKVLETLGKGLGWYLEPRQIERKARSEAKAILIRAEAEEKALDLRQRAERARQVREMREQANIEAVVAMALEQIPEKVTGEPVDADWAAHFFDGVKLVGDEQMQELWAKLLSREVEHPGSFMLRTMSALRVMSATEAKLFSLVARYAWHDGVTWFVLWPGKVKDFLARERGLTWLAWMNLKGIGLIVQEAAFPVSRAGVTISSGSGRYRLFNNTHLREAQEIHAIPFTEVGRELMKVCVVEEDAEYLQMCLAAFRDLDVLAERLE